MTTENSNTLTIIRIFDASPELMFKAWTQPEHIMHWWGPKGFTTPFCEVDLRIGGTLRYCMRSPDGKDFWGKSIFQEIVEPTHLAMKDVFTDEKGNPVPASHYGMSADWPAESQISVTFTAQDGKTKLTLEHSGIITAGEERDMCEAGWNGSFERLTDFLKNL